MMKKIVFCDFDGTITAEETFVGMLKQFASRSYEEVKEQIVRQQLSLGAGVRKLVESIPSDRYPDVLDYIRTKPFRTGFVRLLDFLSDHRIPLVVISGGLLDSVKTRLQPHAEKITAMYGAKIDTTGPYLRIRSEYEGAGELVSKPQVAKNYKYDESIVIGDGITDFNLARSATVVFARDMLAQYCDTKNRGYIKWRDFRDIRQALQARWQLP